MLDYQQIFNQRGTDYDEAMQHYPYARQYEFENIVKLADFRDGDNVCDFPSGGGYLESYITADIQLVSLETSHVFSSMGNGLSLLTTENVIPFKNGFFDKIISLAGIHHNTDQQQFFVECARCLKTGGSLCIGEVYQGSKTDKFLNIFVDQQSGEGHKGLFLNRESLKAIENAGLVITYSEPISYPWVFASEEDMVIFCRKLFGMNGIASDRVLEGIRSYVGFYEENGFILMNWELYFIKAEKP